ncbi:MAG: cell division protein SepF [Clostridia bacterium]|nr:cell division protein SepF [Clostridia bacterium]
MGIFGFGGKFFGEEPDDELDGDLSAEESMPRSRKSAVSEDVSIEAPRKGNKVVNIHATAQLQVVLVKPERFDDASSVADHLNAKRTVVLNLESANKDVARRILDFLSGVAYANDGQIKKVANCTFIITPYNVGLMGDLLDELESNGLYF